MNRHNFVTHEILIQAKEKSCQGRTETEATSPADPVSQFLQLSNPMPPPINIKFATGLTNFITYTGLHIL